MKKILFIILITLFFIPIGVKAESEMVTFSKCIDGDTIKIKKDSKEYTVRFLAIDTPETVKRNADVEPFGKEASNYTCNKISKAKKIRLEYDKNSNKTDKYGRLLAWVYADGEFLQESLLKKGYAEVAYLYGKYTYTDYLKEVQTNAQNNKVGMWSLSQDERDGCVIDSKLYKKSSNKCKSSTDKKENIRKKESSKKQEKDFWDILGDFIAKKIANSIKDFFVNLF